MPLLRLRKATEGAVEVKILGLEKLADLLQGDIPDIQPFFSWWLQSFRSQTGQLKVQELYPTLSEEDLTPLNPADWREGLPEEFRPASKKMTASVNRWGGGSSLERGAFSICGILTHPRVYAIRREFPLSAFFLTRVQ
jgi:hypothetical protein